MCWLKPPVWVPDLLGAQHSQQIRPQTIQLRVSPGSGGSGEGAACLLSGWTAEPHVGMPSLLGLTVGSHQGCGLWANEPGKRSRVWPAGWPELGLGTERTEAQGAPVHPQAARAGCGGESCCQAGGVQMRKGRSPAYWLGDSGGCHRLPFLTCDPGMMTTMPSSLTVARL